LSRHPVTLHISLAPRDLRHVRAILPHQLRQFAQAVEEIVFTIDTLGRPAAEAGPELTELEALARTGAAAAPKTVLRYVDYSPTRRVEVSRAFFQRGMIPRQTYRVGPFHAYFDGWYATTQPYVFHLDSDVLIGGDARAWIGEAIKLLQSDPAIFTCSPLPGPPRPDLTINQPSQLEPSLAGAHVIAGLSTRIFFMARSALVRPEPRLPLELAPWKGRLRGWLLERTSGLALPEDIMSRHMARLGRRRVDFLGESPGCWSLHPPFRNPEFYRRLDEVVRRVEEADLPEAQRGDYDLNDSVIDWSDARAEIARNRWWRRILQ
jgi:hypothetical protein